MQLEQLFVTTVVKSEWESWIQKAAEELQTQATSITDVKRHGDIFLVVFGVKHLRK